MEDFKQSNSMLDYLTLGDTNQRNTDQCYITSKSPEILDRRKAYMNENEKYMI